MRVCPLLVSVFAHAGSAVKEGHTKGLCPTVEESAVPFQLIVYVITLPERPTR